MEKTHISFHHLRVSLADLIQVNYDKFVLMNNLIDTKEIYNTLDSKIIMFLDVRTKVNKIFL